MVSSGNKLYFPAVYKQIHLEMQKANPWMVPKGKVQPQEDVADAGLRILKEQTGLAIDCPLLHRGVSPRHRIDVLIYSLSMPKLVDLVAGEGIHKVSYYNFSSNISWRETAMSRDFMAAMWGVVRVYAEYLDLLDHQILTQMEEADIFAELDTIDELPFQDVDVLMDHMDETCTYHPNRVSA